MIVPIWLLLAVSSDVGQSQLIEQMLGPAGVAERSGNGSLSNGHSQDSSGSSSPDADPTRASMPRQEHSTKANGNTDATAKVDNQSASPSKNGNRGNAHVGAQENILEHSQANSVADPDHVASRAPDVTSADQASENIKQNSVQAAEGGTAQGGGAMHMADAGDRKKKKHKGSKKKKKSK